MKLSWHSLKPAQYVSVRWHESQTMPGIRFAVRRISLGRRIELTRAVRELLVNYEFLKAGDTAEQAEASMADMLARKVYVEWGMSAIEGLEIDGEPATPALVCERGPEALTSEIVEEVRRELTLSEDQRKNS